MNKKLIKSMQNIIKNNESMREGADPTKVAKKNLEEIMKLSETGDLERLQELFKPKGDN
tara:strand:+ start:494 stop:670 length:177 start_codon:yes stop_codon:yes gene_type:complete